LWSVREGEGRRSGVERGRSGGKKGHVTRYGIYEPALFHRVL